MSICYYLGTRYLTPFALNCFTLSQFPKCIPYSRCFSANILVGGNMKIFTDVGNIFSLRVLASCNVTNTDLNWEIVDRKSFKVPGFSGKLPVVEVEAGKYLFNCNAVTRYIFNSTNHPSSSGDVEAKIDELIEWDSQKLQPCLLPLLNNHLVNNQLLDVKKWKGALETILSTLNTILQNKEYLTGDCLSAADVVVWGTLYGAMQIQHVKDSTTSEYSALWKWFEKLTSFVPFSKAVEKVTDGRGISAFKPSLEAYITTSQYRLKTCPTKTGNNDDSAPANEDSENVTPQQVEQARQEWHKERNHVERKSREHPILPRKGDKNILIHSALPYVNNVPHLGNIIGCVLSADVYSRFCRLRNYNPVYICGTDEYGTATETKAIAEGVTPQEICDKYYHIHRDIYKWFNIDFDYFGRTSTKQQTEIAQDIFWKLHQNGYFLEDDVEQLQCMPCNRYLADRFVEGTCPFCKYEDARGDQCDACGKLINAIELISPRCKQCGSSPAVQTSRHIFIDLPKIEPELREWVSKSEGSWSHNAQKITKGWLADGLKPRCITRDLKWGTSVPLEGYTDKVFYVWFDAPIGYISITAGYTDEWKKWWKNPEEVDVIIFMAKDNVPFHSVVFPSSLIGARDNYSLHKYSVNATEYLNYEDDKFSKSRGVGVFGDHAESTGIPADIFRFYLLFQRPETNDSAFQWADFVLKNNSELLNNLGNFVNRALMFLKNSFNSTMPELQLTEEEYKLIASVNRDLASYVDNLEKIKLRDALRCVLNISRTGNQYIQNNQPWLLVKGTESEKKRAGTVIGLSANISALITILLEPYMPDTSAQLQGQLALPPSCMLIPECFVPLLPAGHKIGVPSPLFQKIDNALAEELRKRFAGTREEKEANKAKVGGKEVKEQPVSAPVEGNADPAKVAELEALVAEQGDIVRKAKADKASKDIIGKEVAKLLDLKNSLLICQGIDPNENKKGKSKKGKQK